jgi:2-polyprenyl-3-methyl-5-hydroxy-6-metoxy-1,4-benzoquinol methylase
VRPRERIEHAHWQVPWIRHEHVERYRFASRFVPGRVVVDCACGDGTGTRSLVAAGAAFVHGFDLSSDAVAAARSSEAGQCTTFTTADGLALPLPDSSIDVYVSLETIEHLADPQRFLAEVVRVLRASGLLVCSTPNRYVYSPGHGPGARPWNPFHLREFDAEELARLLSQNFDDVALFGQNPRSAFRARVLDMAGRILPFDLAVRMRQIAKLPLFLFDRSWRHRVLPLERHRPPETLVAVCTRPRSHLVEGDA